MLAGVSNMKTYSSDIISHIKELLCDHRLSRIKSSYLSGYLNFIYFTNSRKYSSKTSFFVPPSEKNLMHSTLSTDIVAQHVRLWANFLFFN